jgi:dCMP deaminase
MVCIILLYGHIGSGLKSIADFLQTEHGFEVERLPELIIDENLVPRFAEAKKRVISDSNVRFQSCVRNWNRKQVIYPVYFEEQLQILQKKIYAHLVFVDASIMNRFNNLTSEEKNMPLERFAYLDDFTYQYTDMINFYTRTSFALCSDTKEMLRNSISGQIRLQHILNGSYRTDIDVYFMQIAFASKARSNCMKRAIGCVLVKNSRIISIGYNGTPRSMDNCFEMGCQRCNECTPEGQQLDTCLCMHAEEGAILLIGGKEACGAVMYTTTFPCFWCAKVIIQCVR